MNTVFDSPVGALDPNTFATACKHGIVVGMPPFTAKIISPFRHFAARFQAVYAHYPLLDKAVPDFVIRVAGTGGLRRFMRRQSMAYINTPPPYIPLPEHMAPLMFEQALNWCVATRTFTHLLLHAAVVEKNGKALIIPGQSGQGKSTLCSALVTRGWRHLSDEFCLLDPATGLITAHPRPISLKNESIQAMRDWAPEATISAPLTGTPKGSVAYIQPSDAAVQAAPRPATPFAVVFPRFIPNLDAEARALAGGACIEIMEKARAFVILTTCSVNYREIGEAAFHALTALVNRVPVMTATYGDTAAGVTLMEDLVA